MATEDTSQFYADYTRIDPLTIDGAAELVAEEQKRRGERLSVGEALEVLQARLTEAQREEFQLIVQARIGRWIQRAGFPLRETVEKIARDELAGNGWTRTIDRIADALDRRQWGIDAPLTRIMSQLEENLQITQEDGRLLTLSEIRRIERDFAQHLKQRAPLLTLEEAQVLAEAIVLEGVGPRDDIPAERVMRARQQRDDLLRRLRAREKRAALPPVPPPDALAETPWRPFDPSYRREGLSLNLRQFRREAIDVAVCRAMTRTDLA